MTSYVKGVVRPIFRLLAWIALGWPLFGQATLIDFEQFSDSESVSNQISGVSLTHALVLQAGLSLNEFDFPPNSGNNVLGDDGGMITFVFASDISSFSAYFTYVTAMTIRGFTAAGILVDTAFSQYGANGALSGDPGSHPSELMSVEAASGIRRVEVLGSSSGDSFVMDDLTFLPATTTGQVPEPASAALILLALCAVGAAHRSKSS